MSEDCENNPLCADLLAEINEYVDGTLPADLCVELEKHMAGCPRCRLVVDTTRKTIALYHDTLGQVDLPEDVRRRLFACLNLDEFIEKTDPPATQ